MPYAIQALINEETGKGNVEKTLNNSYKDRILLPRAHSDRQQHYDRERGDRVCAFIRQQYEAFNNLLKVIQSPPIDLTDIQLEKIAQFCERNQVKNQGGRAAGSHAKSIDIPRIFPSQRELLDRNQIANIRQQLEALRARL